MRLVIWARMEVVAGLTAHTSDAVATGIGNVMANKGGVATGLWIWNTPIIFINSHLAAHQSETKRRNQDYASIVGSLSISGMSLAAGPTRMAAALFCATLGSRLSSAAD